MPVYVVQPGDTLYIIAQRNNTTVEKLIELNSDITDPDKLEVGQKIQIGEQSGAVESTETVIQENDPSASRLIDGFRYTITTDRRNYSRGEPVRLRLVKINITGAPISLNYRTSQRFDFVAFREGEEIWRWSDNQAFSRAVNRIIIQPGGNQTFNAVWDQRDNTGRLVRPGTATIRGYNVARELQNRSVSITINITPSEIPAPTPEYPSGNLLRNPGLEEWRSETSPVNWSGRNINRTRLSKSGEFAAELGSVRTSSALLTQPVNGAPRRNYRLSFWARENQKAPSVGDFTLGAEVFFYDNAGRFISRADPVFNQNTIPERYTLFALTTGLSPLGTARAEARFLFTPASDNNNTVLIDDVDFRRI